jgi:hypothetical protein
MGGAKSSDSELSVSLSDIVTSGSSSDGEPGENTTQASLAECGGKAVQSCMHQVKSRLTPPDIRTYHTYMIKGHVHLFELLSEHDVDYTNYVQDIVHRQCVADDRSLTSEDIATLHLAFLESNLSTLLSERTWVTTP